MLGVLALSFPSCHFHFAVLDLVVSAGTQSQLWQDELSTSDLLDYLLASVGIVDSKVGEVEVRLLAESWLYATISAIRSARGCLVVLLIPDPTCSAQQLSAGRLG